MIKNVKILIVISVIVLAILAYFIMRNAGFFTSEDNNIHENEAVEEGHFLQIPEEARERLIEVEIKIFAVRERVDALLVEDLSENEVNLIERVLDDFQKIVSEFNQIELKLLQELISEEDAKDELRKIEKELMDFEIRIQRL